jgi:hypothetical protein
MTTRADAYEHTLAALRGRSFLKERRVPSRRSSR